MAKRGSGTGNLFVDATKRRHLRLFLPKYLAEEAARLPIDPPRLQEVTVVLQQWSDAAVAGRLDQKETQLDAEFLNKIFGQSLGYLSVTESPGTYHREKNPTVARGAIADGALGYFAPEKLFKPIAIIELKGAKTDLDHDKFNGRTPVDQCWDYLNELPDTQWGIVSNYVTIRLYHKSRPKSAYEEFSLADFHDPDRVRQFFYVFDRDGLLGHPRALGASRASKLLTRTAAQQREVGDKLYIYYAEQRELLIGELMDKKQLSQDDAIRAAQRLLDRIIFMAFCEDRGLLPEKLIENTWKSAAPLARATNPRWQAFLDAFHAIDKGHPSLDLPAGYNGGLFRHDSLIDDLDLEDRWADVFKNIGGYDFREEGEVSVDVLGHIFERSITELEKLRVVGLFGKQAEKTMAAMPKSAERKRFGIYYTPPQFTTLIVEETLGKLIADRVDPLPNLHDQVKALRKLKVVDPACGSGAFLIAAYQKLELAYEEIARQLRIGGHLQDALNLINAYPDYILADNLYGVDLSAESVEITQLALWIRSARRGVPLTDLSNNIRRGNSLIRDKSVHPEAFDWVEAFPTVFGQPEKHGLPLRPAGCMPPPYLKAPDPTADRPSLPVPCHGFDAVIGNPPWERMKLEEREFFGLSAPEIATTANASDRAKLIAKIEEADPGLWKRYQTAKANAERVLAHVRTDEAGFPLTGRGDVNTYMLFAELARKLVSPRGRVGLLLPSGIATDKTTKEFFNDIVETKTLRSIYDFVNRLGLFTDVEGRLKFCVLLMNGIELPSDTLDFVFWAETIEDLSKKSQHVSLTAKDLKLMNPNTRTCPIFRNNRDAEITRRIYRQVPVLIDNSRKSGGNPWGTKFSRMFDATNDSSHFETAEKLSKENFKHQGNNWLKGKSIYLPLIEAKMTRDFDHRASKVVMNHANRYMNYSAEPSSVVEHQNPEFLPMGRWWVNRDAVMERIHKSQAVGVISFHDVARANDQRTMVACMLPLAAVTNTLPLIVNAGDLPWRRFCCLLGNLNSFAYDFVVRQKAGGAHLNFFIVEQIPTLPPDAYDEKCPWAKSKKLEDWIAQRVLKLTCTADDLRPLAKAAGFEEGVHKWKEAERAQLRAELDAAYFHLYAINRDDVIYILSTFQGVTKEDEAHNGEGETRRLVMESYDALAAKMS